MRGAPRFLQALLARLLPLERREQISGDLGEEYGEVRHRRGRLWADIWYATQVVAIAGHYALSGVGSGVGLGGDLRYGVRQLRRNPGFTAVVVIALAIGIGANGMILSVVGAVFLEPLPYPDAERIGVLTYDFSGSDTDGFGISYLDLRDLHDRSVTLEAAAGVIDWRHIDLTGDGAPERLAASFVGPGYAEILGLRPLLGRGFAPEENEAGSAANVALLSEGLWRSRFAGRADVIGRVLTLNNIPMEVVGVLPDEGRGLRQRYDGPADVYLPLFAAETLLGLDLEDRRGPGPLNSVVRWRADAGLATVRQELVSISGRLQREYPATNESWAFHVEALDDVFFEELRAPTGVLAAGALLVFLLVAVNVTSLFLVRATARRHEGAVRRALGAGRGRLLRQALVESLILGLLGSALGLAIAAWGASIIAAAGLLDLPAFADVRLDARVIALTLALAVALTLLLGLISGPSQRRRGVGFGAAAGGPTRHSAGRRARRSRSLLVGGEVCLAFLLLVGAGLMLRSFQTLQDTDYGFDTERLVTLRMEFRGEPYDEAHERIAVAEALMSSVDGAPGVESAFLWSPHGVGEGSWVALLAREGRWELYPAERLEASRHQIFPGTFERAGIPLLEGRDFLSTDDQRSVPVAVVSRSLAERLWPGESPLGRRFEALAGDELVTREVVGVVEDVRHRSRLIDPFGPQLDVYYPFRQVPAGTLSLAVRRQPDSALASLAEELRRRVATIDPDVPLYDLQTMDERLRDEESRTRLAAFLVAFYALLAALLAGLGIYGVLSHAVHQQTREIGVRKALGADRASVMRRILRGSMATTAAGTALGLVLAMGGAQLLAGALYGVEPRDPLSLAAALALVMGVALLASLLPGYRAARIDPVRALAKE